MSESGWIGGRSTGSGDGEEGRGNKSVREER